MNWRRFTASACALGVLLALTVGCGEKIAIPQPVGLYSVSAYLSDEEYDVVGARRLLTVYGSVFVLTADSLTKRNQTLTITDARGGFTDARAFCADDGDSLVFVWDEATAQVSWYHTRDLTPPVGLPSATDVPAVRSCVSMATSRAGVDIVPGAATFLYLADPDSGVVHRYAYYPFTGLVPYGILCRRGGEGTRFVHEPGGLARDSVDSLLVCDRDTLRNWVIRFDSEPDLTDTSPSGEDPLRGHAALFSPAACNPPAATYYVLGDAAECDENDWAGGPSDAEGEFNVPVAVAVDGIGRIFVADSGNDRVQVFTPDGMYDLSFGGPEALPAPGSLATVDVRYDTGPSDVDFAAFVFVVSGDQVRRFISGEHFDRLNTTLPPPQ